MSKEYLPPPLPLRECCCCCSYCHLSLWRNLVQILFDILRWPGDIHCLLCCSWIPLFWFLSLLSRSLSFSLFEWAGNCLQRQTVCQHLQPVCLSLTLSLGYCTRRSSSCLSSHIYRVCECVCVIHKCALVLNVNICTRNSSRRRERERGRGQVTIYSLCCTFRLDFIAILRFSCLKLDCI